MNMISKVAADGDAQRAAREDRRPSALATRCHLRNAPRRPCRGRHPMDQRALPRRCSAHSPGDGRGSPRARGEPVGRLCRPLRSEPQRRGASARLGSDRRHPLHRRRRSSRQGQLLFTVDPRPFTASLAEARAGVATAQSELSLAQLNLGRARRLLEADAVSQANVDQLDRAGADRPRSARRRPGAGPATRPRRRIHPHPRTDRRPHFRPQDRRRQPRQLGRRRRHVAHHDQRARPDLLHLRRAGVALPEGCASAARRRRGRRRRDPPAGRGELQLARHAGLHRQWHQPEFGNGPGARRRPQPRSIS